VLLLLVVGAKGDVAVEDDVDNKQGIWRDLNARQILLG